MIVLNANKFIKLQHNKNKLPFKLTSSYLTQVTTQVTTQGTTQGTKQIIINLISISRNNQIWICWTGSIGWIALKKHEHSEWEQKE